VIVRRAKPAMGTFVAVSVRGRDRDVLEAAARAAFSEIARLEAILSEWRQDSPVSAVNRCAGLRPVAVPRELVEVLRIARDVAGATSGAFDPTWRPLGELWRFHASRPSPPAHGDLAERRALVDFREVQIDGDSVFLRRRGMQLGLGGVAKAYIAERAAAVASRAAFADVLVDAGGDVVARGRWRVAIRHPRVPGAALATVALRDASIATSGDYEAFFAARGRRYHHLLDPRTGYPATGCQSVTVMAPHAALADALSTGLFVLGPDRGGRVAASMPEVGAVFVAADGSVHVSEARN